MSRSKKSRTKKEPEPELEGGVSKDEADKWQYGVILSYGFAVDDHGGFLEKYKARKIMAMLRAGKPFETIAEACAIRRWHREGPSDKQVGLMRYKGLPFERARCRRHAGIMLDALLDPGKCYKTLIKGLDKAKDNNELDVCAREAGLTVGILPGVYFDALVEAGKRRRDELNGRALPLPD